MHSKHHFVKEIREKDGSFLLDCYTNKTNYERITEIICEGTSIRRCVYRKTNQTDGRVDYQVILPVDIEPTCNFYVFLDNNIKKRVWKPCEKLVNSSIPDRFYFTNRFLNLTYNENTKEIESKKTRISSKTESVLSGITCRNNSIYISGYLFVPVNNTNISDKILVHTIKFREEEVRHSFKAHIDSINNKKKIFNCFSIHDFYNFLQKKVIKFTCKIDLESIKFFQGYFNICVEYNGKVVFLENYYRKFNKEEYRYILKLPFYRKALFVPYCDETVNTWRLDIYNLSWIEWRKFQILLRKCEKNNHPKKQNIWIIGEYNNTARDNGMHFFQYLRKMHPSIEAYYVINRDSPDRSNLKDSHVIHYGSYKHFKIVAKAKVLIFSHFSSYLIPKINTITSYRNNYKAYHTIFIQHGVIATTASATIYRKKLREYDRFVVSSSLEKKNICQHLGYKKDEVIITGLARWDKLLTISKKSTDILIMPTWRNDLDKISTHVFKQSNYYKFWNTLLSNTNFLSLVRKNNIKVNYFLHISLARFAHCFELPPEINQVNNMNIQEVIGSAGLFVTDYSSVAFDVLFQDKPVIFCPFDYKEMMELRKGPQFISYEKDLPGPVCYDLDTTVREIIKHVANGYKIDTMYRERRKKFFDHIDNHNCDRLFDEITAVINNAN